LYDLQVQIKWKAHAVTQEKRGNAGDISTSGWVQIPPSPLQGKTSVQTIA
jgi:hypothetical protein